MSLKKLPAIHANIPSGVNFDMRPDAIERWSPAIRAAQSDDATISIMDPIGMTWEGEGVTAKRIGAALRSIGNRDVVVNVNSPGGDFFEGVAIYNLLRDHPARVTVRVMGLAASAASVVAMAGDELLIGDGAFLMIHNAWAVAVGNRHDMRAAADQLEPFDKAMTDVYAARTGIKAERVAELMDAETWINSSQAVDEGWASGLIERDAVQIDDTKADDRHKAKAMVESAMIKAGYSRTARRDAFQSLFSGKPGAALDDAKPGAGDDIAAKLQNLILYMKGH